MTQPILDRPGILRVLFHPRRDWASPHASHAHPVSIQVEPAVSVGGRLHPARRESPAILFFHGNGEIASDYDDLAPVYNQLDITLLVMDYRGYGTSDGAPTAANLLSDAVIVHDATRRVLGDHALNPARLYVMGRSLGSAAAIEIARQRGAKLAGLIVESGFADTFALLARLGVWTQGADEDRDGFGNLSKIAQITTRTLIIHGEDDILIPASDGIALHSHCAASDKQLVLIPNAGHNDLMMVGMEQYFAAIQEFVSGKRHDAGTT